jgi:hypothetical protein
MGEILTLSRALKITYEEGRVPIADFLRVFYPQVRIYDLEEIPMDRILPKKSIASYREKGASSVLIKYNPGKGYVYICPYIDVSTPIDEKMAQSVKAGLEASAPADMKIAQYASEIRTTHDDMITRALVKQGMDIFTTGSFQPVAKDGTPVGEPFPFDRDRENTIQGDYETSPVQQIIDGYDQYRVQHGPLEGVFAMIGSSVLSRLEEDPVFQKSLELQGLNSGKIYLTADNRVLAQIVEMKLPKRATRITIIAFNEDYEEVVNGNSIYTPFMPPEGVIVSSFLAPRMQIYGGIFLVDERVGTAKMISGQMVSDVLYTKNPDSIVLRSQSRPLLVPGNVNHTVYVENA